MVLSTPAVASPARPRTLTEALRALDSAGLEHLLRLRPDLLRPVPRDLADLAGRATAFGSISRALDGLDAWLRVVAEALAALPDPCSVEDVATLLDQPAGVVATAVHELAGRALVWGPQHALHLVRAVREAFEPYPGGLAPPSARPLTPAEIDRALDESGDAVRPVLERLLWSPAGAVRRADRPVTAETARSAVDQLLSRGLLRPLDPDTVILPREVAWRLRSGRFRPEPVSPQPPPVTGRTRGPALVDRAGVGAAFGLLHDIELVAHALERTPHRLLRVGGLSARDVAGLARELGGDHDHAVFLAEAAAAAGLVAGGGGTALPTAEYDRWLGRDAVDRWRTVAAAWWGAERFFARSAESGAHALGPEAELPAAPRLRDSVLRLAAAAAPGTVVDLATLNAATAWAEPRLTAGPLTVQRWVEATWREASWLGLVALGAVTSLADAVRNGTELADDVRGLFPEPVDQIVLQADLTAVASGPLAHAVAAELRLLADQESRGGGGVYRFSAGSLRRGFDAGRSSDQIRDWLRRHAATELPQPLLYLLDDVARRHGSLRVGPAGSFVRVEDEAQLAAILAHPASAALGLRRVGPGVLVAAVEEAELVRLLRDLGHAPAVEDATGEVLTAPGGQRARAGSRADRVPGPSPAEVAAALRAQPGAPEPPSPEQGTDLALHTLREATRDASPVEVVYVTAAGSRAERALAPLDLVDGAVRGVDRDSAEVVTIPLARISMVRPAPTRH